jgi:hypothetical protein
MRISLDISTNPSDYAFSFDIRVRFAETDAMGVAHHSSYVAWLEASRVEFLRELGTPYPDIRAQGFELAVLELTLAPHLDPELRQLVARMNNNHLADELDPSLCLRLLCTSQAECLSSLPRTVLNSLTASP